MIFHGGKKKQTNKILLYVTNMEMNNMKNSLSNGLFYRIRLKMIKWWQKNTIDKKKTISSDDIVVCD